MEKVRIQKIISDNGYCSRRKAEELISQNRVKVNGRPCSLGDKALPGKDLITIDGEQLYVQQRKNYLYIMMYKPRGYVTTMSDELDRKNVTDLLTGLNERVYPVGRLDKNSEGLLLLTNDGNLAHHLTAPRHHVAKIYYAKHTGVATQEDVEAFQAGLCLRDGTVCQPAQLEPLGEGESKITIQEGKYHQVRRMMASRGMTVLYLKRLQIGKITLGDLPVGQCRRMTSQ